MLQTSEQLKLEIGHNAIFLRFSTIVAALGGLVLQFVYLIIDLDTQISWLVVGFIGINLVFFVASFISWFEKHSYALLLTYASLITATTTVLVGYKGARVEYIFALAIIFLITSLFINKKVHVVYFTVFSLVAFLISVIGWTLFGTPQNLIGIMLFAFIAFVILIWSYFRIGTQETVEMMVEKRTEELRAEQNKLRAALLAINGLLIIIDHEGKVVLSNNKYNEVLGINYQPKDISEIQQVFGGSYDVTGAYSVSLRQSSVIDHSSVEFKDKFLRILFAPVYDTNTDQNGQQKTIGVLIIMGDVTEEELLDRARDEFFAIASHELRTPLTAIQGNLALVLEYIDSGKLEHARVLEMLQDAMKSSRRLIRLVHDFLDISRLEQGRVKFSEQQVDIAKLAQEVLVEYEQEMKTKNITSELINNAKNTVVRADEDRVKQVIVNLVSNATKYSQKGKITVTLQPKGEGMVELLVSDTGIGIAPENQKFLFRKFQQAGKNVLVRDTSQGSGLGLYISRLVIRAMGGDVYLISSETDKGSTFGFMLPIKKQS